MSRFNRTPVNGNEEAAQWRFWMLAEMPHRSPEEDEEMLQAVHAAMYFWKIVGKPGNHAHAALLLAHMHALLKLPGPARLLA